jgi:hypothetical protein
MSHNIMAQVGYFNLHFKVFRFVLYLTGFGLVADKIEPAAITTFRN